MSTIGGSNSSILTAFGVTVTADDLAPLQEIARKKAAAEAEDFSRRRELQKLLQKSHAHLVCPRCKGLLKKVWYTWQDRYKCTTCRYYYKEVISGRRHTYTVRQEDGSWDMLLEWWEPRDEF